MSRILTDISDDDIRGLDRAATEQGKSRAAVIREAVKLYLVRNIDNRDWITRGAGFWKDRDDIGDGVEYQRAMREDRTAYEDL